MNKKPLLSENLIKELISEQLTEVASAKYFQGAANISQISNEILRGVLEMTGNDFDQAKFAIELAQIKLRVLIELESFDKKKEREKEREKRSQEADRRNKSREADIRKRDVDIDQRHKEKMNLFQKKLEDETNG